MTVCVALVGLSLGGLTGCSPQLTSKDPDLGAVQFPEPATSDFDPGFLVSDDSFYNANAMTTEQIQDFLHDVRCTSQDGAPCLADFRQNTSDVASAGERHCAAYSGTPDEPASQIIARVAQACQISPRTLIVLLQKEQSLLTKPSWYGYARATGYGCPDTATCDPNKLGFFNQVYNAAWQFRQYTAHPDREYEIGTERILYNPDPSCGGADVAVRNQATANLYNYTPYQPNQAVLADPRNPDTACGSWGNLNFWRFWSLWFGDPTAERYPGYFPPCTNLADGEPCRETTAWLGPLLK